MTSEALPRTRRGFAGTLEAYAVSILGLAALVPASTRLLLGQVTQPPARAGTSAMHQGEVGEVRVQPAPASPRRWSGT